MTNSIIEIFERYPGRVAELLCLLVVVFGSLTTNCSQYVYCELMEEAN